MKKFYIFLCVLSVVIRLSLCYSGYGVDEQATSAAAQYCADLNPQSQVDMSQITGMWYGNEIVEHLDSIDGEMIVNSCVVVHLKDTTQEQMTTRAPTDTFDTPYYNSERNRPRRHSYNYLRLIWEEKGQVLEYALRYNTSRRGFWISSPPLQDAHLNSLYTHSTGTVQVLKAVGNHLVLSFCQTNSKPHLFSVILSRGTDTLSTEDILGVRKLLKRHGLQTTSFRKVCVSGSGSGTTIQITFSSLLLLGLTFLFR